MLFEEGFGHTSLPPCVICSSRFRLGMLVFTILSIWILPSDFSLSFCLIMLFPCLLLPFLNIFFPFPFPIWFTFVTSITLFLFPHFLFDPFLFSLMDNFIEKAVFLKESLSNLSLNPKAGGSQTERILIGKVLYTWNFRRFTISEITERTWKLSSKLQIEKLAEIIFKFNSNNKQDRDYMFRSRPWSLNESLLILKEWPDDSSINNIKFDCTTFHIQIHSLPPVFMHEETTISFGN